jgi:hypothetical protein
MKPAARTVICGYAAEVNYKYLPCDRSNVSTAAAGSAWLDKVCCSNSSRAVAGSILRFSRGAIP